MLAPIRLLSLISALALILPVLASACDRGSVEELPGSGPTNREPATNERRVEGATPGTMATPKAAVASTATPIPTPAPP